ncbi:hypothetical protein GYMLUDRAFT_248656 [Collybiopsis luxurians FD-317 M1]|uniref:Unplaced genomic scaffold GYMLUscaffold_58, whole genome shotgun sequence n=1 Tax=Collybiopsis luxurians FD-317 M1 TaxID=944289 RepID=A0A0D0BZN0_9AGAR|nr:hypothetical protein GYMLUDRAFT_248656 [Collybiopsis luxurians FD-317 M1]
MSMTKFPTVAVLANLWPVFKHKTILFDANFYVSSTEIIVAALHFYNVDDLTVNDITKVILHANISKMPPQIATENESLYGTEYNLIGDIVWLMILQMYHLPKQANMKQQPFIDIIGTVHNVLKDYAEFNITSSTKWTVLAGK